MVLASTALGTDVLAGLGLAPYVPLPYNMEQYQIQCQLVALQATINQLATRVQTLEGLLTGTTAALQQQVLELYRHLGISPTGFTAPELELMATPPFGCADLPSRSRAHEPGAQKPSVLPEDSKVESVSEVLPVPEMESECNSVSFGDQRDNELPTSPEFGHQSKGLAFAMDQQKTAEALALLCHHGFKEVNAVHPGERTALHHAAAAGLEDVCRALLNHHDFVQADAQDIHGRTALHHAARRGHAGVCRLLLQHPRFTKQNEADAWGRSAMADAIAYGHTDARDALLEHPGFELQGPFVSYPPLSPRRDLGF